MLKRIVPKGISTTYSIHALIEVADIAEPAIKRSGQGVSGCDGEKRRQRAVAERIRVLKRYIFGGSQETPPTLHEWYEQRDKALALEERLIRALRVLGEVARCQPIGPMERQIWYEVYKIIDDEADWYRERGSSSESADS